MTITGDDPLPKEDQPSVLDLVLEQSRRVLDTYRIDPGLIQEHANGERRIHQGGYGDRQIYELVQNGADELRDDPGGEIAVILTDAYLYCANQGMAITPQGVDTILRMGVSRKRGGQIGRFGVGVKSVLSVTDSPQFFSREDGKSFGFDREWSEQQIRAAHPGSEEVPVLRMAQPIDRDKTMVADPILAELLKWATTVVRLPLKPTHVDRLGRDLRNFPAQFSLFSPHVGTVTLEDRRSGQILKRQVFQNPNGDRRSLQVDTAPGATNTEHWRVFTRTFSPSPKALLEAGELHDRPKIDVSWAVPDRSGRDNRRLGEFWAYFPTKYKTTLRGIINAPWKTSEDRQNLYDANTFNEELIQVAAGLVVDSFEELSRPDDRCAHLDAAPARGREEPQWAAADLVQSIWKIAATKPTLPDQDGRFGTAAQVRLHPAGLEEAWRELWAGYENRPKSWCHHSVEREAPHRRQSAERILREAGVPVATVREWLEALVADESPEASARAILILADMKRKDPKLAEEALKSKIVLTESTGLVAPSPNVFRRSSNDRLADRMIYVDERVFVEDAVRRALDELGVHEADAAGRFTSIVEQGFHGYSDGDWDAFWELSRQAGPADTLKALRDGVTNTAKQLKVRTVSAEFRRITDCLLPGRIVPADGSRDARIAVDMGFHDPDRPILRDLGLRDGPGINVDPRDEPWFKDYTEYLWKAYCKKLPASESRPQLTTMQFDGASPAGPLHFLTELSPEGIAAFVRELPSLGLVTSWTMQVGRLAKTRQPVMSPLLWMARKYGRLATSRGIKPVARCVGPMLRQYADVLPVASVPTGVAEALKLPGTLSAIGSRTWTALVQEASASEEDAFPGKVYALFFEAGAEWPGDAATRCRVGDGWTCDRPDGEIAVTANRAEYDELIRERVPALLAPTDEAAEQMRETWGMLSPEAVIEKDVRAVPQAEPVSLTDEFPYLKLVRRQQVEGWSLVRCSELQRITRTPSGERATSIDAVAQPKDHVVYVLDPEDDVAALTAVDKVLKLGLGPNGCRGVVEKREEQRKNQQLQRARQATDTADKMLHIVKAEELKKRLPPGLLESDEEETGKKADDRRVAELAVDAYGTGILRTYRKEIEAALPEAAASFRGDSKSLRLVNDLGLSEAYAGTREQTLPPTEIVSGPTAFPRLHDYQEKLASNMFDLLTRYRTPRAMLSLPTGAGKTRVAAEAVIRVIKERGLGGRPVLWIAQSEELCEQAVQSWAFVWSKVGPEERLTINRLWSNREAAPAKDTAHLIVATDAKLENCLEKDEYVWLRDAALVIVDEAHTSITPRYTRLLSLLGITHRAAARPLIGLTATPYRGFNEEETRRLVERYGRQRLDEGIFESDPYTELQELGVLAKVEHRQLVGATIQLTPSELANIDFQGRLPAAAEERLGMDSQRNRMLVEEIEKLPDNNKILLFATSVGHAKLMAAKLNGRRIKAASIDGTTPDTERRTLIENFRTGRIRVLTNYGVLVQGFDAPATQTVIVARPTYSPNVYQQMIGRGLRGPKNGGKETCLILDVADNITNYDKKLAFTQFEHLWSRK